jgi:hypothetical protein
LLLLLLLFCFLIESCFFCLGWPGTTIHLFILPEWLGLQA